MSNNSLEEVIKNRSVSRPKTIKCILQISPLFNKFCIVKKRKKTKEERKKEILYWKLRKKIWDRVSSWTIYYVIICHHCEFFYCVTAY